MKYIYLLFLLPSLFLSGCTAYSSLTQIVNATLAMAALNPEAEPSRDIDSKKSSIYVSDRILKANGHYRGKASITSIKEIKKKTNKRESYQECHTKKYDKNQKETSPIDSFFNTSDIYSRIVSIEFCETKYRDKKESRFSHYLVEYEYEGNTFTYTTKKKPDLKDKFEVKVIVVPEKYKGNIYN